MSPEELARSLSATLVAPFLPPGQPSAPQPDQPPAA
jgi:hypothetical protein